MNKALTGIIVTAVCVGAIAIGAYLLHRHSAQTAASSDDAGGNDAKPVASVTVTVLTPGSLPTHTTAFGTIVARPEMIQIVSVPYESLAVQTSVSVGQRITRGQTLLQVRPSVAARATLDDARNAVAAAERDLAQIQQRYNQQPATNAELFAAQNALRTAQNHLNGLTQVDPTKTADLKSDTDGFITRIDAQPGQTLPVGAPLIELIPLNGVQAKIAVDSSLVSELKTGQSVELTTTSNTVPLNATISALTNHFDPMSHFVDVYLELPSNTLSIDTPLIAKVDIQHGSGFVIPHDAVVPNEDGAYEVFTVKGDKAVLHTVLLVSQDDEQVQITSPDLKAGDLVVVTGNYVLEDGMSVNATAAPAPATRPAAATTRPEPGDDK